MCNNGDNGQRDVCYKGKRVGDEKLILGLGDSIDSANIVIVV